MARLPWLDRAIGTDRLAHWHRRNGQYTIGMLAAHAVLIVWGYALSDGLSLAAETRAVVLHYPDVLAATAALGLLIAVAVTSARAARQRLRYETWYFVHLYTYLAIALSFAHQLATGDDFITHPLTRALWVGLFVTVAALVAGFRVGVPLRSALRHRLRVVRVVRETPTHVSVYVSGRHLTELAVDAGQHFRWRFLTRGEWWQSHPYSLSAVPDGKLVHCAVRDQGRGVPENRLEVIFERFEQVDSSDAREKGGTGLGLSISRSIVERLGGQIWAENNVDGGSTFSFTLPEAVPPAPDEALPLDQR
jgi:predicted ferric reductase